MIITDIIINVNSFIKHNLSLFAIYILTFGYLYGTIIIGILNLDK